MILASLALLLLANPEPVARARLDRPEVLVEFLQPGVAGEDVCGGRAVMGLSLEVPAEVSLDLAGTVAQGSIDGTPRRVIAGVLLSAGRHTLSLAATQWPGAPVAGTSYRLRALGADGVEQLISGAVVADVRNPTVLRVGREFLAGVDLFDGHVARQAMDIELPGRHLMLRAYRSYTGTARVRRGSAGLGWSLGYTDGLAIREECGLAAVPMGDGARQTFRSADGGRTYSPVRGYHTRLRRLPDGAWEFEDKAGIRFRFGSDEDGWGEHRLERIEEPHGDRVVMRHDGDGRLREAAEAQAGAPGLWVIARALRLEWTTAGGFPRVAAVDAPGLGWRVEYGYDDAGRLTNVRHLDEEVDAPRLESYQYALDEGTGQARLLRAEMGDGTRAEYVYLGAKDVRPGADPRPDRMLPMGRPACVAQATEIEGQGKPAVTTRFSYDHDLAAGDIFVAVTESGPGTRRRYVLNRDGSAREIHEPDGVTWNMEWDRADVLKLAERNSAGVARGYRYDERGNLVEMKEVARAGAPVVTSRWAYDPRFAVQVLREQPGKPSAGRRIDPATGDVLESEDGGKVTRFRYDTHGCLLEKTDGTGVTRYFDHDTFGFARRQANPDGKVQRVEHDPRGREVKP